MDRVHQSGALVLGRTAGQAPCNVRRVAEDPLLLGHCSQGRQRIEQHLGGPRVRAQPARDLTGRRPAADCREHVELDCREQHTALPKGPGAFN